MQAHRTTKCSAAGHREFTVQLANKAPIPDLQGMLINYFEAAVARGSKFLPGQTIQMGWSVLRVCERKDGTLGVEERVLAPEVDWTESVDRALVDMWLQREVNDSVGLLDEMTFPRQDESALISECAMEADQIVMTRLNKSDTPDGFSGWLLACTEDHDHGERQQIPLLGIAAIKPGLVQMFALPPDTSVLVLYKEKASAPSGTLRIEPHVFRNGEEITPGTGSYLASLQG